jgi:hypothetical protein
MKQNLLTLILAILCHFSFAQSNTCLDAESSSGIQADVLYSVGSFNGDPSPLNCTENSFTNGGAGLWYKYVPDADYEITINTDLPQNTGRDPRVHVLTGSCGNLVCAGGDDDSGTSFLAVATLEVFVGNTYYIVWDNRWPEGINFDFILTEAPQTPPPPSAPVNFSSQILSLSGSGRGLVDLNGDFLDDAIAIETSSINVAYQQPGGGLNIQSIATTPAQYFPSWSLAVGDWDANGYNDLLYGGNSGVTFMRANSNGTAYTQISGPEYVFSQRSHFVDINNDGDLDVFVCHDVQANVYYINDGENNLQFFQGPNPNGVPSGLGGIGGNYGSIWIDYDNDGLIDMFIAKCRGGSAPDKINQLWKNKGMNAQGKYDYEEVSGNVGVNLNDPMQTWSSVWADFDSDGDMDVFVGASTLSDGPSKLMRNNGDGTFTDVTSGSGFNLSLTSIENIGADFDNDGNVDILFDNGIYFGNGDLTFTLFNNNMPNVGSVGDLNNDGFLDIFDGNRRIFTNSGNSNNWIKISTVGKGYETQGLSNRNGIGARVEISTGSGINEVIQIRDVRSGEGFRHMSSLNTHFGIGQASSINYIKVKWPSGIIDQINDPDINTHIVIEEASNTLSIENTLVDNLIMYPNPTKDFLNLSFDNLLYNGNYTITDLSGKIILNSQLNSNKIDVSNITNGIYFLSVTSEGVTQTQKFIKQ